MEREIEFGKLRYAYTVVKSFLENETLEKVNSLDTKIAEDLSLWGDDNYFMLIKFVDKFELDYSEFEYDKHFESEGEIYGSMAVLWTFLNLSIWLPLKTIELLTLNKIKIEKPTLTRPEREVSDLTFRELLTWYIEGKYSPNKIEYKVKTSHNTR